MAILTEFGEEELLNHLFARAGTELCLAINEGLTECSDEAYARIDLPAFLGEPANGIVLNDAAFTFNSGDEVVGWWFVTDPENNVICYDVLPTPQIGEFRFPVGALRLEAISG